VLWIHWREFQNDSLPNYSPTVNWRVVNAANQDLIRSSNATGNCNKQFSVWEGGGTFTNLGAVVGQAANSLVTYDVRIDFPSRIFQVYQNNVLIIDVQLPAVASGYLANLVIWNNLSRSVTPSWKMCSEIIVADEPTVNMRVLTRPAIANGALTDWNGPVTNINELQLSDANGIDTGLIDQLRSFTIDTPTGISNVSVRAVCIGARASSNGTSPDEIQGLLRIGGSNFFSSNILLSAGITGRSIIFNTNPATGVGFTLGDINAGNMQFGFASRA
jgi:hypothetical protein